MAPETLQFLDEHLAAFVTGGVSLMVATRGPQKLPNVVRAVGCRLSGDRRRIRLLLPLAQCRPLLDDIRANGAIAVMITKPSTHEAYQFKGIDAQVAALEPEDEPAASAYLEAMSSDVERIGFSRDRSKALLGWPLTGLVPVAFTPVFAFDQTPGPLAGAPLRSPR